MNTQTKARPIRNKTEAVAALSISAARVSAELRALSDYHANKGRTVLATRYRRLALVTKRRVLREHGH